MSGVPHRRSFAVIDVVRGLNPPEAGCAPLGLLAADTEQPEERDAAPFSRFGSQPVGAALSPGADQGDLGLTGPVPV